MATFQKKYGWAAILGAAFLTACGPGTGDPDGGDCPLNSCATPDGGDAGTDGGNASVVKLYAPEALPPTQYTVLVNGDFEEALPPLTCGEPVCTYTVPNSAGTINPRVKGAEFTFQPQIPGYHAVPKNVRLAYEGQHHDLAWMDVGEIGVMIGDGGDDGHWPYRDPEHANWGLVYFQTSVITRVGLLPEATQVVLNDYGGVGAHKLLGGDNFVVVTGLSFSGQYEYSGGGGSQEFSGTISLDRETITYHLVLRDASGNIDGEDSGMFHRFRQ